MNISYNYMFSIFSKDSDRPAMKNQFITVLVVDNCQFKVILIDNINLSF